MKDIIRIFADALEGEGEGEGAGAGRNTSSIDMPGTVAGGNADIEGSIIGILNGVIGVIAIVCVVVIVIGGIQYMTSAGDAGKVKKAKDTILYAVIGLVVCALAATIVNFVVSSILSS
jgi:hypothetical protein